MGHKNSKRCGCCGATHDCNFAQFCVIGNPDCPAEPINPVITLRYTPTADGTPATVTLHPTPNPRSNAVAGCIGYEFDGTVAWTIAADNFLEKSGTTAVKRCRTQTISVPITRNTYTVNVSTCGPATVTVTAEGTGISGTKTQVVNVSGTLDNPLGAGPIVSFAVTADRNGNIPAVTVTVNRQAIQFSNIGYCGAGFFFHADAGYNCCPLTNIPDCSIVSRTLQIDTPVGTATVVCGHEGPGNNFAGGTFAITKSVLAYPKQGPYVDDSGFVTGRPGQVYYLPGCGYPYVTPVDGLPVTFYGAISCGWVIGMGYLGCGSFGHELDCTADAVALEDVPAGTVYAAASSAVGTGISCVDLTNHCPPGLLASGANRAVNRYLSGSYTLTEG